MAPPPPNNVDKYTVVSPYMHNSVSTGTTTYTKSWTSNRRRFPSYRLAVTDDHAAKVFYLRHGQKRRWWHLVALLMAVLGLVELLCVLFGAALLYDRPSPIRIGKK